MSATPKRIVISLDEKQRKALDKLKETSGSPLAFMIRKAIDQYLKSSK
jgi:hypothetical protein